MTPDRTELWLTYHQTSRATKPSTAQLIELDLEDHHHLSDLEDVLDHVFRQGFVDAKYRTCTYWEKKNGVKVKGSYCIEELLKEGVGKCEDSALKLVIADIPNCMWFTYVHVHNPCAPVVVQRVKTDSTEFHCEKLAHITNHIFGKGYLPNNLRRYVRWEKSCGQVINEDIGVVELFESGQGLCEDRPLRLIIDQPVCTPAPKPEHHGCHCQPQPVHHCCHHHPVVTYNPHKKCHCH